MMNAIKAIAAQLQHLNEQAYMAYRPLVDNIIAEHTIDNQQIECLLDGVLDFCADHKMLELYKQLCRYYYTINPVATVAYINYYKEMWG